MATDAAADESAKAPSWPGWAEVASGKRHFGLELQVPYADHLLSGRKPIETRSYPLPPALLSDRGGGEDDEGGHATREVRIEVLESERGRDGVSSVPDVVCLSRGRDDADGRRSTLRRRGWVTFVESFRYASRVEFEADAARHLVEPSSGYGWRDDRPMYGWVVGGRGGVDDDGGEWEVAMRRMRSLFELRRSRGKGHWAEPTIVITGASGMLGRALHRLLLRGSPSSSRSGYRVIGTGLARLEVNHYPDFLSPSDDSAHVSRGPSKVQLRRLDLLNHRAMTDFLTEHRPDVIVHCAAERYPDAFESKLEQSVRLNVDSTRHLAAECRRLSEDAIGIRGNGGSGGPHLIYVSTSYVFDGGSKSGARPPYTPQSRINPLNSYGRSKWEGECVVREALGDDGPMATGRRGAGGGRGGGKRGVTGIIVRVPLLYGEDCVDLGESPALEMMKTFLPTFSSAPQGKKKRIDHWALRFPTSTEDVARALGLMIDGLLEGQLPEGTYHVSSPHGITKYDLMRLQARLLGIPSRLVEERAEGNAAGPPEGSAPRPRCTQLDCAETWRALGLDQDEGGGCRFEFATLEGGMKRALHGFPGRFEGG